MKRNKLMEESRKQITPEIRELVDKELKKINKGEIAMKKTDEHTENKPNWRAELGEEYYYIIFNCFGYFLVSRAFDYRHGDNESYYNSGNYFRTKKEAEKYIGIIKDLLINRK